MKTRESEPIELSSAEGVDVVLNCLTVEKAESLLSKKNRYFQYIFDILKEVSNLGDQQLKKLSIQDSISLLVYYRMYFWDDAEVATGANGKPISPSDFIRAEEDSGKKQYFKVGNKYTFSPIITLGDAISAEKLALQSGDYKGNLRRYIIAAGCTKGIEAGLETLNDLEANAETLGQYIRYNEALSKVSPVQVDFMHKDGAIMIVTQGGEPTALPFRGSIFFTFWV